MFIPERHLHNSGEEYRGDKIEGGEGERITWTHTEMITYIHVCTGLGAQAILCALDYTQTHTLACGGEYAHDKKYENNALLLCT